MRPKTANERKLAERERMRQLGLKRFESWLHPDDRPDVRKVISKLNRNRGKQ